MPISTKLSTEYPWVKEIQGVFFSNDGAHPSSRKRWLRNSKKKKKKIEWGIYKQVSSHSTTVPEELCYKMKIHKGVPGASVGLQSSIYEEII